jgi:hypothetical protein
MRVVKCSEPERFQPVGYWASQGLETEDQVRWEMMWQAATSETDVAKQALEHAEGCDYCGHVLDQFRGVAYAMKPGRPVDLAICPSAAVMVDYLHDSLSPALGQKVAAHLRICKTCEKELKWLTGIEKRSRRPVLMTPRAKMIVALAAAAVLVIAAGISFTVTGHTTYTPIEDKVYSNRYHDLALLPYLDRADLIKAAPPSHWNDLDRAMSALELDDNRRAIGLTARLISQKDEAAAEYVMGRALFKEKMLSAAEEALLKSERMDPPSPFRCWTALQIALILANKPAIMRECQHLANNPEYSAKVQTILDEVKKRG